MILKKQHYWHCSNLFALGIIQKQTEVQNYRQQQKREGKAEQQGSSHKKDL